MGNIRKNEVSSFVRARGKRKNGSGKNNKQKWKKSTQNTRYIQSEL